MLHTISNKLLSVSFDDAYGEVCKIIFSDMPVLKEPVYGSWPKSWPVMFPICGKLKENKYLFGGKTYEMPGHGFFRSLKWKVSVSEDRHFLRAEATNVREFEGIYPFAFSIALEIAVAGSAFFYTVEVSNAGHEPLYYNTGHHGAFMVDPSRHSVSFEKSVVFKKHMAAGGTGPDLRAGKTLRSAELDFDSDCSYQAADEDIARATLHSGTGYAAEFIFETFNVFTLWAKPHSDWLCLEPWNGNQDVGNEQPREIATKPLIRKLEPGRTRSDTLRINFSNE